ncbi:MAG TPA: zinc-binding dehydrogenase [Bryobacteraceae bacterium]|nr:zinc-binding dehydrogenase [Bryobacteraceae bacterium]
MSEVRAAVLEAFEKPLEIRSFPDPGDPGPGEALVGVDIAGICGTDVHLWLGQLAIPLPNILGHESAGRIEKLGAGLDKDWRGEPLRIGDRVTWASSIACGECFYCRVKRQPTRCLTRKAYGISYRASEAPHLRGGYAEKILLRAGSAIFRIPDSVPSESLIGAGCALTTAIHASERAPLEWGDTVVVQGTGPVGLAAIAVARVAGAGKLVAIGGPKHRLELAREFGADVTIDIADLPTVEERRTAVFEALGPYGADQVIECVGYPDAVNEGILLCRDGGQFVVLGQYADAGNISFNPHTITRKQLRVIGSWGFEPRHVDRAIRLLERDSALREKFARGITHRFPLAQADEALQTARRLLGGKTVILPGTEAI